MIRKKCLITGLVLMAAIMAFTACGKKEKKEADTTVTETTEQTTEAAPIDMTKAYSRGRVNGQEYTNKFFNYSCTFDDEWRLYTDEEIDQINSFQAGAATDENVALVLEESYLLDMAAARYDGKGSISIIVQTINQGQFSERDYAESGLNATVESLLQSGYTDVKAEIGSVKFCGRERVSIDISAVPMEDDASTGDADKADNTEDVDDADDDSADDADGTDDADDAYEADNSADDADNSAAGKTIYENQITVVNGKYISVLTFKSDSEKGVNDIIAMFK